MLRIPPPGVNLSCVYAAAQKSDSTKMSVLRLAGREASAEHCTRKVATEMKKNIMQGTKVSIFPAVVWERTATASLCRDYL